MLYRLVVVAMLVMLVPACSAPSSSSLPPLPLESGSPTTQVSTAPGSAPALAITVHKSPTCGCCSSWVDYLRREGFQVAVVEAQDLAPIKQRLGVPAHLASCHTAQVGNLFVEGHVPAQDIRRMVADVDEGAAIRGIAVSGMPVGSPGMEMGDRVDPYQVIQVAGDGQESVFSSHPGP